jgi:hypothetical protein
VAFAMTTTRHILATCVSALLTAGCAISGPVPHKIGHSPDVASEPKTDAAVAVLGKGKSTQPAIQTAEKVCSQDAERKTMGSFLYVVTHLRPRAYWTDYEACMKANGYEIPLSASRP